MRMPPTDRDLVEARAWLAARDPALARANAEAPELVWRVRPGGFEGLLWMIVGQQVSTASAAAIWTRVSAGLGQVTPDAVIARGIEGMRALGLSLPKARYALALAEVGFDGQAVSRMGDEDALASLIALKGIGRWTAEVYLMFCDARTDILPSGDIALQEAIRWADRLEARPGPDQTARRAEAWGPYRSTAAHLLWAWYGAVRRGEIAHPMRPE